MPTEHIRLHKLQSSTTISSQKMNLRGPQNQVMYFRLKLLSPLHIGCDEVYEPTSFVIDEKRNALISFDPFDLLEKMDTNARQKFSKICQEGTINSLLEIYKFIYQHAKNAEGEQVVISKDLISHYQQVLNMPIINIKALNEFKISRTAFNPFTNISYIPGSSMKGAIRTAVLNWRNQGKKEPFFSGKDANRELQKHLLSFDSLQTDPFRMLKVSDFMPITEPRRSIVYGVNRKKKMSKKEADGPYQLMEVIEPGAEFIGMISLTTPEEKAEIQRPITKEELIEALKFYRKEKAREDNELKAIAIPPVSLDSNLTGHLIRIGRHSGAECVTIAGRRKIKIKGSPAKTLEYATTIWLAAPSKTPSDNRMLRPFGWAILQEINKNDWLDLMQQQDAFLKSRLAVLQERTAQKIKEDERIRSELAAKEAEKQRKEAEEQRRKEEEASLMAKWNAMTEEERELACIRKDDLAIRFDKTNANDPIGAIWKKLDTASPEHQKALARAFMERWQAEGKWTKKECSKKQFEKVQKVKEILGIS